MRFGEANLLLPYLAVMLTVVALCAGPSARAATPSAKAPIAWVAPSMERIARDGPAGAEKRINLWAARGEYESCQIVVRGPGIKLTNVNVRRADLAGTGGHAVSQANVWLYREQYVYARYGSPKRNGANEPLGPGWYPDALISFFHPDTGAPLTGGEISAVPFDLEPDRSQPIWVDIFVPRDAAPGDYETTFIITSDQGEASVSVDLTVWNFELPLRPSLKSWFALNRGTGRAHYQELLRHKMMPAQVPAELERELMDKFGLTCLDLGFSSGAYWANPKMSGPPTVEQIRQRAAQHQQDLYLYDYTADEIGGKPELYDTIKAWARNLHAAGIPNLITMTPKPELLDDGSGTGRSAVDIWVLLPEMYDAAPDMVRKVLAKGDQVWSYEALVQDGYSPKWELDFAPINYRIVPGFINQSLGLTGYLYWQVDRWNEKDPWNEIGYYTSPHDLPEGQEPEEAYPGEGQLAYPGAQVGLDSIVPSLRMKWYRDGADDYEYVQILKALGREPLALELARRVGRDWHTWTRDPRELEAVRRQLGEAIESATRSNPPGGKAEARMSHYVSTTGDDRNPGTRAQPWRTIQKAAETLVAGDTVYIRQGTYLEHVVVRNSGTSASPITFAAYPGETASVDGSGLEVRGRDGVLVIGEREYVRVLGLRVVNSPATGIMVRGSRHVVIERCSTYDTADSGIGVWRSAEVLVTANEVVMACHGGSQECITIAGSDHVEVTDNHVHDRGDGPRGGEGIDAKDGCSYVTIRGNHVHHTRLGIYVDAWKTHSHHIEVVGNVVHDCDGCGLAVASERGGVVEQVRLVNNIAYHNRAMGIVVAGWDGGYPHPIRSIAIINNTVCENGWEGYPYGGGIAVEAPEAQAVVIRNNICSRNRHGQILNRVGEPAVSIDHNLIAGYLGGERETLGRDAIQGDPRFVSSAEGDYRLLPDSPAINAGTPEGAPETDFRGLPRPQGAPPDIGACGHT